MSFRLLIIIFFSLLITGESFLWISNNTIAEETHNKSVIEESEVISEQYADSLMKIAISDIKQGKLRILCRNV